MRKVSKPHSAGTHLQERAFCVLPKLYKETGIENLAYQSFLFCFLIKFACRVRACVSMLERSELAKGYQQRANAYTKKEDISRVINNTHSHGGAHIFGYLFLGL